MHAVSERAEAVDLPASVRIIYCFEPVAGVLLTFAAAPVLLISAVLLSVLSRQSPFIAHRRVANGGTPFWMWKLRTMWTNDIPRRSRWTLVERIDAAEVPERKFEEDPRVTSRFARFCRKYSIDELPQLAHVATGRMSLVGPRPITADELNCYYRQDAAEVLRLRAGLTGLWQVNGRNTLTYAQRRELDLQLVREYSAHMYFRLLWKTIPKVLSGADSR